MAAFDFVPGDPRISEAVAAMSQFGNQCRAAEHLGISRSTLRTRLSAAQQWSDADPALTAAAARVGSGMIPAMAWIKTAPDAEGVSYSVQLRPKVDDGPDLVERISTAFSGLSAAPVIAAPLYSDSDLLTVYPLADCHVGAMAWGRETGEDYDTNKAVARIQSWIGQCIAASPASSEALIIDVGDLTHADDQTNQTPASKHNLDVDTRHFRTLELTIAALASAVEAALAKHQTVRVVILPGNHNPHSYLAVLFALAERYRDNPRVNVRKEPGEFFLMEHGSVMVAAHHGDKAKAERMVLFLADQYPEAWGRTRHRFLFTGHLHHHKSADIGGVQWEQLRAVTAKDAYAASNAFSARSQMQAITYDKTRGEVQRVKVGC